MLEPMVIMGISSVRKGYSCLKHRRVVWLDAPLNVGLGAAHVRLHASRVLLRSRVSCDLLHGTLQAWRFQSGAQEQHFSPPVAGLCTIAEAIGQAFIVGIHFADGWCVVV